VIQIGLAGFGTVGGGVWKFLQSQESLLTCRTGKQLKITKVATRTRSKAIGKGVPESLLVSSWKELIADPKLEIIVELMGGIDDARALVSGALQAGKHVVTANKALLAAHGEELITLARQNGRKLLFEASVAGGIPILKALNEGLVANRVKSIHGIINGTCNYILTTMRDEKRSYEDVLVDAKRLGYAEAEESLDVDGHDTAHKAAVLAALAYGVWVPEKQLFTQGIRSIQQQDIVYARQLGYEVKLLAIIKNEQDQALEIRVNPTLIPLSHMLASVDGVFNAISLRGDVVGDTLFYGRGAGEAPTTSAVLADLVEIVKGKGKPEESDVHQPLVKAILPMDEIISRYYLHLTIEDKPGVLAQVASVLGKNGIGISSVIQPESHQENGVPLIIMLHDAKERQFLQAIREIEGLSVVKAPAVWLRVEDFL
jgi:homoserine dehydrogenase